MRKKAPREIKVDQQRKKNREKYKRHKTVK